MKKHNIFTNNTWGVVEVLWRRIIQRLSKVRHGHSRVVLHGRTYVPQWKGLLCSYWRCTSTIWLIVVVVSSGLCTCTETIPWASNGRGWISVLLRRTGTSHHHRTAIYAIMRQEVLIGVILESFSSHSVLCFHVHHRYAIYKINR